MHLAIIQILLWGTSLIALLEPLGAAIPVHHDEAVETPRRRLLSSALVPRSNLTTVDDQFGCGRFSTGDWHDIAYLLDKTRFDDAPDGCFTPARTCRRVACKNTSGIYVCNDNFHDITLSCHAEVAPVAESILFGCCGINHWQKGTSGQRFVDPLGYNVVIGYANCEHDKDADRPSKGPANDPWGPNGKCHSGGW